MPDEWKPNQQKFGAQYKILGKDYTTPDLYAKVTGKSKYAEDFRAGFIAESPEKLRRLLQYFTAIQGSGVYPPVRCNAPEFSAVIGATGRVQPCFFIAGPAGARLPDLPGVLNGSEMRDLRRAIRAGERGECKTCVCSLWRNPVNFERAEVLL